MCAVRNTTCTKHGANYLERIITNNEKITDTKLRVSIVLNASIIVQVGLRYQSNLTSQGTGWILRRCFCMAHWEIETERKTQQRGVGYPANRQICNIFQAKTLPSKYWTPTFTKCICQQDLSTFYRVVSTKTDSEPASKNTDIVSLLIMMIIVIITMIVLQIYQKFPKVESRHNVLLVNISVKLYNYHIKTRKSWYLHYVHFVRKPKFLCLRDSPNLSPLWAYSPWEPKISEFL